MAHQSYTVSFTYFRYSDVKDNHIVIATFKILIPLKFFNTKGEERAREEKVLIILSLFLLFYVSPKEALGGKNKYGQQAAGAQSATNLPFRPRGLLTESRQRESLRIILPGHYPYTKAP